MDIWNSIVRLTVQKKANEQYFPMVQHAVQGESSTLYLMSV